jgi:triacylglycerol lipase
VSYAHVASVERSCRQAVGMLTEAWANASAAARIVRAQGHRRVLGDGGRELRRGTLSAHPVMLVHGLGADKSCFNTMEGVLHRAGHTVYSVSYSCWDADVAACANDLERETSWLLAETGADRVQVVAHSLGGVALRWSAAHTRMGDWLSLGITLGSPHGGSPMAHLAPTGTPGFGKIVSQLRPGVLGIDDAALGQALATRWVALAGANDLIVPPRYARLPDAANVRNATVPWAGHLTLTRDPRCLAIITSELEVARPRPARCA